MAERVLLSWSSGKDSAWTLHTLNQRGDVEVAALITTFSETFDRVAMHATRRQLVRWQAEAAGLPLIEVELPYPCSNAEYQARMDQALARARDDHDLGAVAFGDLFLEEIRAYRESQLKPLGLGALFPLWEEPAAALARTMIDNGLSATLCCVDPRALPADRAGCAFDHHLLSGLPDGVDPCGENGEFHTVCHAGPMFSTALPIRVGQTQHRDGFVFCDILPAGDPVPKDDLP